MGYYIENEKWRRSTGLIFSGVLVQYIFGFICFSIILYLLNNIGDILISGIMPSLSSMSFDYYEEKFATIGGVALIFGFIAFIGYIIYLVGICLFKGAQTSPEAEKYARNIMLTELAMPILLILYVATLDSTTRMIDSLFGGLCLVLLPWAVFLAAVIFLMTQFKALAKESSWSEKARKGADDLKFSYSCIIWIQVVTILGIGIIALTIWHFMSEIQEVRYSMYSDYGYGSISSVADMAQALTNTIKVVTMFISIITFVLLLFLTVYRIIGWSKIRNGGAEEPDENTQASSYRPTFPGQARFCHKCGTKLPANSSFCPLCGTPVAGAETSDDDNSDSTGLDTIEDDNLGLIDACTDVPDEESAKDNSTSHEDNENTYDEDRLTYEEDEVVYDEDEPDNKKKWIFLGAGIVALAIVGACLLWCSSADIEPNAYVLSRNTTLFDSVDDGLGIGAIGNLDYGTPVECAAESDADGEWIRASYEKDGKVKTGYLPKSDLIDQDEFRRLENAGFSDKSIIENFPLTAERLAILDALKMSGTNWSIDVNGDDIPNSARLTVEGVSPSKDCVAFVLRDGDSGERKMFLYSTPDLYKDSRTSTPVHLYSEIVKRGNLAPYSVKYRKKARNGSNYDVTYTKGTASGQAYHEEPKGAKEPKFGGYLDLRGAIGGKFPITMQITEYDDGSISGIYKYDKYNMPITVTGQYFDHGLYHEIEIQESVDGEVAGYFVGKYDGLDFSGTWRNADGTKDMPFEVSR